MHEILVTLTRGKLDESHHSGAYAVYRDGQVVRSRGDVTTPNFLRSSAKPFQAMATVESGAADKYRFTDEELALVVGSHNGSPRHADTARAIFDKVGESPELLRCGGHRPLSRSVYEEYIRSGKTYGRIEDNCSGKHAGMVAAAKAFEADPATYYQAEHPVQRHNFANVAPYLDVLFRTHYRPDHEDYELGITDENMPRSLPGQVVYPFLPTKGDPQ